MGLLLNLRLMMFICALPVLPKSGVKVLCGREFVESAAPLFLEARALGTVQGAERSEKKRRKKHTIIAQLVRSGA